MSVLNAAVTDEYTSNLTDYTRIWTHNHLVCKWTLDYFTNLEDLAWQLSVDLQTKCLWARIRLQLLNLKLYSIFKYRACFD